MNARRLFWGVSLSVICLPAALSAVTLANRVFVSARSGNDANSCSNILTPCQTFAGAVLQLNPGGEAIVLDSGGYGPVTVTQTVTIEAPAGVTAFVHPPSGDAITINAGASDVVTLRGLVLSGGSAYGIKANVVGTLNVENCFITGFVQGISMYAGARLNVKETDIVACSFSGICLGNDNGVLQASIDHCHLDGNGFYGFLGATTTPGSSTTTATYTTANNNSGSGWRCGDATDGQDVLNLEFCAGSENGADGLGAKSDNAQSAARYSNCVFANNADFGVDNFGTGGTLASRGNNTITGNASGQTHGTIGSFSPM